jgi:hypothetical protein
MARATRQVWTKRVEEWTQSGLERKRFAAKAGINASTLAYWKWRLGAEAKKRAKAKPVASSKSHVAPAHAGLPPLTFVEIGKASLEQWPIEIELLGGERVRVGKDFDAAAFTRVLDVLDRRR